MPQKRNADAAELVRGKAGALTGGLMQMLMIMKGLPLTYNKDMQDDKATVFAAVDTLGLCLEAMAGMLAGMSVNKPFREAHHITGALVKMAETKGIKLGQLELADMQAVEPGITDEIYKVLQVRSALQRRGLIR